MSLCARGPRPRSCVLRGNMLVVSCVAFLTAGCAHEKQNSYSENGWYAGGPRQQAAAVPVPVEMEDDGKPAQVPPPARARAERDDPREPWSPNYGGRMSSAIVRAGEKPRNVADAASE